MRMYIRRFKVTLKIQVMIFELNLGSANLLMTIAALLRMTI